MLKLHDCDWSKGFSLDAVGNAGDLTCEETKTSREYEVPKHDFLATVLSYYFDKGFLKKIA